MGLKYVPTFESFTDSQKLNEGFQGPLVDGIEELMASGIGIKKAYDQMKKSLLIWSPSKGLKVIDYDFNGFLIRIKTPSEAGYTSINVWDAKDDKKAKESHQKEHGFPLDDGNDANIVYMPGQYKIYRGQWESTKAIAKTFKLRDFMPLSDSGDNGLGGDEADAKWEPVLDAFGVSNLDDLVWLGAYFPEIVEEEGKSVDSFSLDSFGDEDPHGDVSISVFKWKGMLLASHDDDYRYSGTLCKAKDSVKLAKLLEGDEGIDIGE
tara:strand:- start:357 stop:1148 length:792 start_codon:yes stop_codon:yes gene_type:complete